MVAPILNLSINSKAGVVGSFSIYSCKLLI
nr:MAG TPA: hypothetical protein [Caudoviricetes sp.]